MLKHLAAIAVIATLTASPTLAATQTFEASLSGHVDSSDTGSMATASGLISVETGKKTVDMIVDVTGLKISDLWDKLVAAPVGPIHLHNYKPDGVVDLVLPAPFGAAYKDTSKGFSVTMKGYSYEEGANLLKSDLSFADFMNALAGGQVVLNVHTNKFSNGEISGKVKPVASTFRKP
jgi:CHRD domain